MAPFATASPVLPGLEHLSGSAAGALAGPPRQPGRQSQRTLAAAPLAGRADGKHLQQRRGQGSPASHGSGPGPSRPFEPVLVPRGGRAAGQLPQTRRLARPAPRAPLTEEALHDPKRVAEPVLPAGHLAEAGVAVLHGPSAAGARLLLRNSAAPRPRPPTHSTEGRRSPDLPTPPGAAAAAVNTKELQATGWRGARAPASTSHNGGKQPRPTALLAIWVELAREGRWERAARLRAGGRGNSSGGGAGVGPLGGRRSPFWKRAKEGQPGGAPGRAWRVTVCHTLGAFL